VIFYQYVDISQTIQDIAIVTMEGK